MKLEENINSHHRGYMTVVPLIGCRTGMSLFFLSHQHATPNDLVRRCLLGQAQVQKIDAVPLWSRQVIPRTMSEMALDNSTTASVPCHWPRKREKQSSEVSLQERAITASRPFSCFAHQRDCCGPVSDLHGVNIGLTRVVYAQPQIRLLQQQY